MTRGKWVGLSLVVAVLAGCSQSPAPPTATTTQPASAPSSSSSSEPAPSSFTPDEAGFVAAIQRGDPGWKWPSDQLLIDTGWNICTVKESSPDIVDGLLPNPKRRDVYLDAVTTYLCP